MDMSFLAGVFYPDGYGYGQAIPSGRVPIAISTYEALAIFLVICSENESNRKCQNRFNHSGETISRKFTEVLESLMEMAKYFLVPKDANFRTVHKKIVDDRRAFPHFKDCIGALDGTHIRVSLPQ
jgi:hypothetical protein